MKEPRNDGLRELGGFALGLAGIWMVVLLYVVHAALPYNPLRLPYAHALRTTVWAPEGWAFFTKSPREPRPALYRLESGGWADVSLGPHAKPSNAFGMNRRARAQGVELGLVLEGVSPKRWSECTGEPRDCLSAASAAARVANRSPGRRTLCGTLGVVRQKPVPWAWARAEKPIVMPSTVIRLEVAC
ncbi:MAG TPA: SdpA family antimicrobial peptide system protein [Longimicrobium sp.]|nr:SdpA family antimicrobial peptide system protein [Longimicrobium sp.]